MLKKKTYRIWLNQNLSSTVRVIEDFRNAPDSECFHLLCSHQQVDNPIMAVADCFELEPVGESCDDASYLSFCLDIAARHKIDLFWPRRRLLLLAANEERFKAIGVKLILPTDCKRLALIENKAKLYRHLRQLHDQGLIAVPSFATVTNVVDFEREVQRLLASGHRACFKPAVGIYGRGFHAITSNGSALDRFLSDVNTFVSAEEARFYLAQRKRFKQLIVMQYLPGDERSVDCLAQDGVLRACVSRVKTLSNYQLLEDNSEIFAQVRLLTSFLKLNGIFNIQFKDDAAGKPCLLEINPRMAGGLPISTLSGFDFFYWAIKMALEPDQVHILPEPKRNIKVIEAQPRYVILS